MTETNKDMVVENEILANDVSNKIPYETLSKFLVKPLEPVMVKKEFSKPVTTDNKPTVDENGVEATDYKEVETEVKEVESDYTRGIVLKVPHDYQAMLESEHRPHIEIKIGSVVVYPKNSARWFDICKDSQLVPMYAIEAVEC